MRVINTTTLQLEDIDPEAEAMGPKDRGTRYAILSHTWGREEVLFEDIQNLGPGELATRVRKKGARKVIGSCIQAKKDGYGYIWVDTCCIDKSSSTELSEAINSMFKWYALAGVCYAYLGDVATATPVVDLTSWPGRPPQRLIARSEFLASKWFTRGWTLQELIAPNSLIFFDRDWVDIGTRSTFSARIGATTSINVPLLNRPACGPFANLRALPQKLEAIAVSTRMTWAEDRETTRGEDLAYCLMGLFDVNMPLLYGEGGQKAFTRLQREIITVRSDQSILAWTFSKDAGRAETYILAPTPRVHFLPAVENPLPSPLSLGNLSMQGIGVQATVFLGKMRSIFSLREESYAAVLQFQPSDSGEFLSRPALHLERLAAAGGDITYRKVGNHMLWLHMGHSGKITAAQHRFGSKPGWSNLDFTEFKLTRWSNLDFTEFKLTTITLLDGSADDAEEYIQAQLPSFVPPLSIEVSHPYRLHASTTKSAKGYYIPPSSLPTTAWKWFCPCQDVATIRTGVLCFTPAAGVLAPSRHSFLVVWSVQLSHDGVWPRRDNLFMSTGEELNRRTSWWNGATPLLHVVPYSALNDDLRSGLEALEQGTAKGQLLGCLRKHLKTLDGLFGETLDSRCACWITNDIKEHVSSTATKGHDLVSTFFDMDGCAARSMESAEAAAEKWVPLMVPKQEVTLGEMTVTASIRKLRFLDRVSFSLDITTRPAADSGATQGGGESYEQADGDSYEQADDSHGARLL